MAQDKQKLPYRVDKTHVPDSFWFDPAGTMFPEIALSETALPDRGKTLSKSGVDFLYKEYDNLKGFYIQAEQTAQSIFNFYLTLITTITGGIVILLQVTEKTALNMIQSEVTISAILLFAAVIGSVYLSSITGRYAHMDRYAHGMDQIRHFLMERLNIPLPPVYHTFLDRAANRQRAKNHRSYWRIALWFLPSGTYMLFIAAFNSLSLAFGVGMLLLAGGQMKTNLPRGALVIAVIFCASFLINNMYSRWVRQKLFAQMNVQFDSHGELDWIGGKQ